MNNDDHHLVLLYENMKTGDRVSKVIILRDGRILLLQKNGNMRWELPGGHVLPKEKMSQGACREVREETGIRMDKNFLHKIRTDSDNNNKINIYRYSEPVKLKIKLSDEHVNYKWVAKEQLDDYNLSKSTNHLAIISSYDM